MNERLERMILETTEMTCETLAFMFPVPPPDREADVWEQEHSDLVRVRVYFRGPFDGSLVLTLPRLMLPVLAANMLGLEEDDTTSDQRADAARELCNVICGNLLPAVAGGDPVFSVSPPELCDGPPAADSDRCVTARTWLDDGWVEVEFTADRPIEALEQMARDGSAAGGLRSVA